MSVGAIVARIAAVAALALAMFGTARAQDIPEFLRGSFGPQFNVGSYMNWSGPYFGAQAGFTNMDSDFTKASKDAIAFILRSSTLESEAQPQNWLALPSDVSNGGNYGVFFGYNMQWDRLVLGFDVAYNRLGSLQTAASSSIARTVAISTGTDNVFIKGRSTMALVDYATLRGRAGYAVGQFLPYAILGLAAGRFDYTNFASVRVTGSDNLPRTTATDNKDGAIAAGLVTGLGIDVALMPNLFLRGEWEFVMFGELTNITNTINTGRVGIAFRF